MARELSGRIVVEGVLEALDPVHVGCGRESFETDMALAEDGLGRLYAPGSSLAGPLRHWCQRAFGDDETDRAWGFQKVDQGNASHLIVDDALIIGADGREVFAGNVDFTEVRDGVGIDREWGAAAHHIKFDRAVLQRGTRFRFCLTLELPKEPDAAANSRLMLGHLVEALQDGEIRLGAAKTRGLGRVRLVGDARSESATDDRRPENGPLPPRIVEQEWSRQGVLDRLRGAEPERSVEELKASSPRMEFAPSPRLLVSVHWNAAGPVMVKAGVDGLRVDTVPLLGGLTGGLQTPVIPGSSLKGILRGQAERIVRTVCGIDGRREWAEAGDPTRRFLAQLDRDLPLVQSLFGSRSNSKKEGTRGMGSVMVADCFADPPAPLNRHAGRGAWSNLYFQPRPDDESAEAAALATALAGTYRRDWQNAHHVAIDRWTGGAAENQLYQVLEPFGEKWPPFELEFDIGFLIQSEVAGRKSKSDDERIAPEKDAKRTAEACWTLLLLALRDLASDRIPVGFGGNRGLGSIAVDRIVVKPRNGAFGLTDDIELLPGERGAGWFQNLPDGLRGQWTDAWRERIGCRNNGVS